MTIKLHLTILAIVSFALLFPTVISAVPAIPLYIYGDVSIGGVNAPVDTTISAEVSSVEVASFVITEAGKYGIEVSPDDADVGDTVVLKVNGAQGGEGTFVNPQTTPTLNIDLTTYTLTVDLVAGEYNSSQLATLTSSGSDSIYYTVNGDTPSDSSTEYTGAITINSNQTLKAIAYDDEGNTSEVLSTEYTFSCSTASVDNGSVSAYPTCAITCDSGYTLTDGACVASGGGGGGGGGGSMSITTSGSVTASKTYGGQTTVTDDSGNKATVRVSANTVSGSTKFKITPLFGTSSAASGMVLGIASGRTMVGNHFYNFTATRSGEDITSFDKNVKITIYYSDGDIEDLDEDTLKIYYWDEDTETWKVLTSTVYKSSNKIVAYTDHFTYYSVMDSDADTVVDDDVVVPISEMTQAQLRAKITEIMAQIQVLLTALAELKGDVVYAGIPAGYEFTRDMKLGMAGNDVKYLQIILNASTATRIRASGVGSPGNETNYFGSLTKTAVIKFQDKYYDEILEPWGFASGTGYAGRTTREKLNEMLGQ